MTKKTIQFIQAQLDAMGFDAGAQDGILGTQTLAALNMVETLGGRRLGKPGKGQELRLDACPGRQAVKHRQDNGLPFILKKRDLFIGNPHFALDKKYPLCERLQPRSCCSRWKFSRV